MSKKKMTGATLVSNKNAYREYFVLEKHEAGIELVGTEVKSIRQGSANLKEGWCGFVKNEIYLHQMHISPYDHGNIHNVDPIRPRKLLMHRYQIDKLYDTINKQGLTLIPLSLYLKKGRVKVEVGVCKGKKLYDKRDTIKKREDIRSMERAIKEKQY